METIYLLLGIIMLVFGILQIILFFKLWGLTNNIVKIKNKLIPRTGSLISREIHKKNPDIANILYDNLWADLEYEFQNYGRYSDIVIEYKKLYDRAGVEFPSDIERIKCDDDYRLFYKGELKNESK